MTIVLTATNKESTVCVVIVLLLLSIELLVQVGAFTAPFSRPNHVDTWATRTPRQTKRFIPTRPTSSALFYNDRQQDCVDPAQRLEILEQRAFVEERLLRNNQGVLEKATKEERQAAKRLQVAQQLVFGDNGYSPSRDRGGYGAIVLQEGVARINKCLSKSTAARLLQHVNYLLEESIQDEASGAVPGSHRFGNVQSRNNRWDLLLPLSRQVKEVMHELLCKHSTLVSSIESILGHDAELYELSCIISDPGSTNQVVHPDFVMSSKSNNAIPPALTCFVSLNDITPDMGPTTFLPRSATTWHYEQMKDMRGVFQMLKNADNKLSLLNTGDVSLYNPQMLHCGGANRSNRRRCLFYMSFWNPSVSPRTFRDASMRPELKGSKHKLSLQQLKLELQEFKAISKESELCLER